MITFHLYGFFIGLGIVVGLLVVGMVNRQWSIVNGQSLIMDIFPWVLIPGLIGARLYHVIDYWQYYSENPIEIFYLWQGGFGIFGAIGGGLLGLWIFLKLKVPTFALGASHRLIQPCLLRDASAGKKNSKFSKVFLSYLDLICFGLPVGQAIGRLGNYFNQELYGLPTNLPWGIYIRPENRVEGFAGYEYFHPLFFYEAVWSLIIFIILITVIKIIKRPKPGTFFFLYLGLYGFGRFWLEFLRINPWEVWGINTAQGISLGLVVIGLIGLIRRIGRKNTLGLLG